MSDKGNEYIAGESFRITSLNVLVLICHMQQKCIEYIHCFHDVSVMCFC